MQVQTTTRCKEKACPFSVLPGQTLCQYHLRIFTYGVTLEDRASPIEWSENGYGAAQNNGYRMPSRWKGFSEVEKQVNREGNRVELQTQMIASGGLIRGSVAVLKAASDRERSKLFREPLAAQEVWKHVRFPDGFFCCRCSCTDFWMCYRALMPIYICKLCRTQRRATSQTIFTTSKLTQNQWLEIIWRMHDQAGWGAATRIYRECEFVRTNWVRYPSFTIQLRRLNKAAMVIGMENFGWGASRWEKNYVAPESLTELEETFNARRLI